MQKFKLNDSYI